jgi:hypothetical protein
MSVYGRSLPVQSDGAGISPLVLRPVQAAWALGISPRKLWGMTKRGEIPHLVIGRQKVYPLASLQRWIDAQTKAGTAVADTAPSPSVSAAGKGVQA